MVIGPKNNVLRHISTSTDREVLSEGSLEGKSNSLTGDANDVLIALQGTGLDPDYHIWSLDQKKRFQAYLS